jgi:hypothetical protein
MANNGVFQFSSPASYSDWANYAGFDRTTGEIGGAQASAGVAPPASMQDYMGQRLGAVQNKLSAIAPAMAQAGQGNITQAIGMMRNPAAPKGPVAPGATNAPIGTPPTPTAPVSNDYDYESGIETSGLNLPTLAMPTFG